MKNTDYARFIVLLLPLLLLGAGCHRDDVQVYTVSSDQNQTPLPLAVMPPTNNAAPAAADQLPPGHPDISSPDNTSAQSMPGGIVSPDTSAVPLTWTPPDGWSSVPPSEMRVASFKVTGANGKTADVSIVPLPGMAGGDAPNVNRWRGQVGLAPATDDEIQSSAENIEAAGEPAALYDVGGTTSRILGVIQHRDDNNSWFYKMTGDPDLVEQQKPVFIAFLKSLSFTASQGQAQLSSGQPDISDGMNGAAATGPISHDGQPNWQVPASWTEVSGGQFLTAKFTITGDNGATAAVNVSVSAGDGGGLAPNFNPWRGQLGLQPADNPSTTPLTVNGGQAQLVDFTGTSALTGQPAEIVGIIVSQPDRTWFYKLMGDPGVVAAQKDAFIAFVKGVKY
jgi:hypothetical protein